MIIEFRNVGRGKRTWRAELPDTPAAYLPSRILREVQKNGGLASRVIDIEHDEHMNGTILVGGFRPVGEFGPVSSAHPSTLEK